MTREEIDVLWQQTISESVKETQYKFANLILEKASLKAEQAEQAEPVAYLDANYGFMRCGNAADHLPIGTKLYAVPPQPAPGVPEGYQLVPIEPTKAMMWALYGHWVGQLTHLDYGYYKAMLSAAKE